MYGNGEIFLGDNSYIGNRSSIQSLKGCKVIIGNNCSISHNVRIYTANRDPLDIINNKTVVNFKYGNVIIGNNVWIGSNVFINQGVKIGNNCVVGANAVLTKDCMTRSILLEARPLERPEHAARAQPWQAVAGAELFAQARRG